MKGYLGNASNIISMRNKLVTYKDTCESTKNHQGKNQTDCIDGKTIGNHPVLRIMQQLTKMESLINNSFHTSFNVESHNNSLKFLISLNVIVC